MFWVWSSIVFNLIFYIFLKSKYLNLISKINIFIKLFKNIIDIYIYNFIYSRLINGPYSNFTNFTTQIKVNNKNNIKNNIKKIFIFS